jgi:DNA-binding protein YbaB
LETDQWLRDFEAQLADLKQKSEDLQEGLATASSTVTSRDGAVTVTVGPNGGLRDLRLGHRAVELGAAGLTALILQTTRTAQRQMIDKVREAFQPLGAGTEAMDLYMDAVPDDLTEESDEDVPAPPVPPEPEQKQARAADEDDDGRPW